jgi:hypothetical protein
MPAVKRVLRLTVELEYRVLVASTALDEENHVSLHPQLGGIFGGLRKSR